MKALLTQSAESDQGRGLLDGRALWAVQVGPQRLAMAARNAVTLFNDKPALVFKNIGVAEAYAFIGVALPFNATVNPLQVVFSKDESMGFNTGLPVLLRDNMLNFNFTQLLMPGEQLFAQIMGAAQTRQLVVVASELF